ncbi:MAG: tetratricopeptide repeat protein [Desulfovibrionaceae bacterium]|nr:tetratricopeptide repeat protein [Desulfovibrionaceae bacterium]
MSAARAGRRSGARVLLACAAVALALALALPSFAHAQARDARVTDLLVRGTDLAWRGDAAGARTAFAQALDLEPDNVFALNQLALAVLRQGDAVRARSLFARAAALDPRNAFSRLWLGILALDPALALDVETAEEGGEIAQVPEAVAEGDVPGNAAEAEAHFNEVLTLDPANAAAHYFLGVIRLVERDLAGAVRSFRRASAADSDDPQVHYRLARAYDGLDMAANAQIEYRRALELEPDHHAAREGLGWRLFNDGSTDAALEVFRGGMRSVAPGGQKAPGRLPAGPGAAVARARFRADLGAACSVLARRAEARGATDEAARLWRCALENDPRDREAARALRSAGGRGIPERPGP